MFVDTAPHEFRANVQFVEYGIEPYLVCYDAVEATNDERSSAFTFDSEPWTVTIRSQSSGLQHPGETLPTGTQFPVETVREFRIHIRSDDDPAEQRRVSVHLRPRWHGQQSGSGQKSPSVPHCIDEGVNLGIRGVNIEFDRYHPLVKRAFVALGLDAAYFATMHESSTILDAERYVRVHEARSGPLFARDGPLSRLAHVLQNDRDGRKWSDRRNTDEHGRNVPGYYHTVTLSPEAVEEAFTDHALPKTIKHYHARETVSLDDDEALSHPKLCVKYQRNRWNEKVGMSTASLDQLTRELEETILSVLHDANLPLRSGLGTYVSDAYFEPTESSRDRDVIDLGLDRIEDRQSAIVWRYLSDNPEPTAREVLMALISDGSTMSPKTLAERIGRHVGSVRRVLRKMSDLVDWRYGEVALRSPNIASLVKDTLCAAKRQLAGGDERKNTVDRVRDEAESALFNWKRKYSVQFGDPTGDSSMSLDLGSVERSDIQRLLRSGFHHWRAAGRSEERYRNATFVCSAERANETTYLSDPDPQRVTGKVYEWLR